MWGVGCWVIVFLNSKLKAQDAIYRVSTKLKTQNSKLSRNPLIPNPYLVVPLDFNQLRELLAAIAQTDIAELTLKSPDFELTVRKGIPSTPMIDPTTLGSTSPVAPSGFVAASPAPVVLPSTPTPAPEIPIKDTATTPPTAAPPAVDPKWEEVKSPMVGTFYRAPGPDEVPFVEVGDRIRAGQTVCIIEAMKLMNEIESEVSGQIIEILVMNGEPVEYGQPLMRVNPGQ